MNDVPYADDYITWVDDTDPNTAPQPNYTTWAHYVNMYAASPRTPAGIERTHAWLLKMENVEWCRGRVAVRSPIWRAMLVARALGG